MMNRIIIIGGGIAGLSVAIALRKEFPDAEVIIVESSTGNSQKGFGMLLMNNGVKALEEIGADALLTDCFPITRALIKQEDGKLISDDIFQGDDEKIFCCSRQNLIKGLGHTLDALDASCANKVVLFSKKCSGVTISPENHVTKIMFSDETALDISPHDLVVACDGYRSIMCSTLNPNITRPISPVNEVVSSSYAPELARKIGSTFHKTVSCSTGLGFGLLAPTASEVIGFVQFDTSKHDQPASEQEKKALFELLVSTISDPSQREMFENYLDVADMENAHLWKPVNSELPSKLNAKNAVLVGDAAHPLLPFTSQGVSMAIEDAIVLANCLKKHRFGSLSVALEKFVECRRPVGEDLVRKGRQILAGFLESNPVAPYCTKMEQTADSNDLSLFDDECVDFDQLISKAYNHRWATVPQGVIPLTAADSDFEIAQPIKDTLCRYISDGYMNYTPTKGLPELREAIASKHKVSPDCVFVTNAAASSMFLVMSHLLNPGDEVIFADPIDFLFERAVRSAGGVARRYCLQAPIPNDPNKSHWSFDIAHVEALVNDRTKVIGICNPHNPVGRVWNKQELHQITDLAIRHNLKIWSDEVWSDMAFVDFETTSSLSPEVASQTYTVLGFSKGYGLAGLRLGAIIAPTSNAIDEISRMSGADDTGYGVSVLSQVAGISALKEAGLWQRQFRNHVKAQCFRAVEHLNRIPHVHATMPQGTFVVFANVAHYLNKSGFSEEDLVEFLKSRFLVAVVPGSPKFFGPSAAGHIRLSVATSNVILQEALLRIELGLNKIASSNGFSGTNHCKILSRERAIADNKLVK